MLPRTTVEMRPWPRKATASFRCNFVFGIAAMGRRALLTLFRCEQAWARLLIDISRYGRGRRGVRTAEDENGRGQMRADLRERVNWKN